MIYKILKDCYKAWVETRMKYVKAHMVDGFWY